MRGRLRRFVVAEHSMLPTLRPGDGLLAVRIDRIRRGEIRIFEHPTQPGFWLVKRVGHVRGDRFEALSDHPEAGAVDSRRFGDVPIAGSYRLLVRVPSRLGVRRRAAP
jgi:signal peptidase I